MERLQGFLICYFGFNVLLTILMTIRQRSELQRIASLGRFLFICQNYVKLLLFGTPLSFLEHFRN